MKRQGKPTPAQAVKKSPPRSRPKNKPARKNDGSFRIEICILAGGLSSRMGRDKSKLRLGGSTLLAQIRRMALKLEFPVRIIRRDLVPRCGPLGGIYTALKTTSAESVLFLACDMPLVSEALLKRLLERAAWSDPIFTWSNGAAGFPFLLKRSSLPLIEKLLKEEQFSLQALARASRAKHFPADPDFADELLNVNTPGNWMELKKSFSKKASLRKAR